MPVRKKRCSLGWTGASTSMMIDRITVMYMYHLTWDLGPRVGHTCNRIGQVFTLVPEQLFIHVTVSICFKALV